MGNSVKLIDDNAFLGCNNLKNVTFPDSVVAIRRDVLDGTAYFKDEANRDNGVLYCGNHVIDASKKLRGAYSIKEGTKTIAEHAFELCSDLESLYIPASTVFIGQKFAPSMSFRSIEVDENNMNFSSLGGVLFDKNKTQLLFYPSQKTENAYALPSTVTKMDSGMIWYNQNLKDLTFPDSVDTIKPYTLINCLKLESITIPKSIKRIERYAIASESNSDYVGTVTDVFYEGSQEEWNKIEKGERIGIPKEANIHYNVKLVKILLNGNKVVFDQMPIIENGRTLVPLRAIFEALGASVGWDDATQTVTAQKGDVSISLQIGSNKMYVNGAEKVLDVPAKLVSGRTLVPVRAISEAFGCGVKWDDTTWTVLITE